MANPAHLEILSQGVEVWNKWREKNPKIKPDLEGLRALQPNFHKANFRDTNLRTAILYRPYLGSADFSGANLDEASLDYPYLNCADFIGTSLVKTEFIQADLSRADFSKANLFAADLSGADLTLADFSGANLSKTDLSRTKLISANLTNAKIERAKIYGISAWNLKKDGLIQKDLIITFDGEPEITVDDLEVAQFIYLMLNNQKIRDVIETITSKAVLILGRFTPERKVVLDALKDELRRRNYLPIVFDFENAGGKSLNETMSLLARMARFIVADITDAKAVREELALVIPQNPSIPVVPLVLKGQEVYSTFDFPKLYRAVLPLHEYDSPEILLQNIIPAIIAPAEQKVAELRGMFK